MQSIDTRMSCRVKGKIWAARGVGKDGGDRPAPGSVAASSLHFRGVYVTRLFAWVCLDGLHLPSPTTPTWKQHRHLKEERCPQMSEEKKDTCRLCLVQHFASLCVCEGLLCVCQSSMTIIKYHTEERDLLKLMALEVQVQDWPSH